MKGVHLFPQEEKQQGLNAPPGRAEIVETDYDPVINMTFAEYENNLQEHAQLAMSVHEKMSALVVGLITVGALSNAWNPVGWVLAAVALVIRVLVELKVFNEKSAWDKDRAEGAWNEISNYYEYSVLGERTGETDEQGRPKHRGGLASMLSSTHFLDETVQTMMNTALKGLCIYEAVFLKERSKDWSSKETKANLDQLRDLGQALKSNFLGKIKTYERVYNIEYQKIPVNLGDSLFSGDLHDLKVRQAPIDLQDPFTDVTFELIAIKLKRKPEYEGAGITFSDFKDAASPKASFLEKVLNDPNEVKGLFELGKQQISTLKLDGYLTADEADRLLFKNWMNTAPAYDKAEYSYNWNMPFDPKAAQNRNLTEGDYLSQKCQGMDRVLQDFANKVPPYQNATAQDVIKVLKDAKAHHDKQYKGKPGSGFCKSVARGGSPGAAYALKKPLIGVHHIEGHIAANYIEHDIKPPFLCLVVSGGHTQLAAVKDYTDIEIIGKTCDDAAGEAFDKVARSIGLGYPGGPKIDAEAKKGDPYAIVFPKAKVAKSEYDFSFSGVKSAVLNYLNSVNMRGKAVNTADVAASFQKSVVEVLVEHTVKAAHEYGFKQAAMAGGVAANSLLRETMKKTCDENGIKLYYPSPVYCTDNAAMIGAAAYYDFLDGKRSGLDLNAFPALKLGEKVE